MLSVVQPFGFIERTITLHQPVTSIPCGHSRDRAGKLEPCLGQRASVPVFRRRRTAHYRSEQSPCQFQETRQLCEIIGTIGNSSVERGQRVGVTCYDLLQHVKERDRGSGRRSYITALRKCRRRLFCTRRWARSIHGSRRPPCQLSILGWWRGQPTLCFLSMGYKLNRTEFLPKARISAIQWHRLT